jgi:hypothetical protein
MKIKRSSYSSQLMILVLAAIVVVVMINAAKAQTSSAPQLAQSSNQGSFQNSNQAQVLSISMPQKSLGRRLLENTSLSYYQQFLGPTASGSGSETYNVFQEGIDSPGSGRAPLQSFHAVNLRHQINTEWAIGTTLSAVNGYTDGVVNVDNRGNTFTNSGELNFFNARAYVSLPALKLAPGTFYTTVSYEAPTSNISKDDEMRWGWVVAQSFALKLPDLRWNAGLMGQVYRIYYKNNVKAPPFPEALGGRPVPLQTMIISGGPYVNYRFNDRWMLGSVVTFDWDQRGLQASSRDFNNNLSDRARMTLSYFPQKIKYVQSVGLFSQALLKFAPETTAFGADFAVRF